MFEPNPVQRCPDQCHRVGIIYTGWGIECQSASPTLRGFGMDPREDHPTVSDVSFNDGGSSVWIFSDNFAPARQLRTIFPIVSERGRSGAGNHHRCFPYTLILEGIEAEFHTRREIEPVVWRLSGKECPRANP